MRCPSCHQDNVAGERECSSCGTPLTRPDHTVTIPRLDPLQEAIGSDDDIVVSLGDLAPGTAVLVVRSHPQAGERFVLADLTRLGRHPDSDISLDDITVSRRHVEIRREVEGFVVVDVGSLNGTYVNQTRIDRPTVLRPNDDLQIGKFHLVFLVAAQ